MAGFESRGVGDGEECPHVDARTRNSFPCHRTSPVHQLCAYIPSAWKSEPVPDWALGTGRWALGICAAGHQPLGAGASRSYRIPGHVLRSTYLHSYLPTAAVSTANFCLSCYSLRHRWMFQTFKGGRGLRRCHDRWAGNSSTARE